MPTIKVRRGLRNNLPTLQVGEFGLATDTEELFIGTPSGNKKIYPVTGSGGSDPYTKAYAFFFGGAEVGAGGGGGLADDCDKVDGFHASQTPTASYLYPLDSNAKFPNSVLYASSSPTANHLVITDNNGKIPNTFLYTSQTGQANYVPLGKSDNTIDSSWFPNFHGFQGYATSWSANSYYIIPYASNCTALTTLTLTANRIYFIPFCLTSKATVDSAFIYVSTAASADIYVGIYQATETQYYYLEPRTLLCSGYVSASSTGEKYVYFDTSATINKGTLYFVAVVSNGTPGVRAVAIAGVFPYFGMSSTSATAFASHKYASFSPPLPSSFNYSTALGTGSVPAVIMCFWRA